MQQGGQPDAGALAPADPVPPARRPGAHHPEAAQHLPAGRRPRLTIVSELEIVMPVSALFKESKFARLKYLTANHM